MAHHHENGRWYVDTDFINKVQRVVPGASLEHLGFGEFYLQTPKGRIDFDRMRGKEFPGQSGRSHWATDDQGGKLVGEVVRLMEQRGKSDRLASHVLRIAASLPKGDRTRRVLLGAVRTAREEKGPGGLLFDFDHGFTVRTYPTDPPYNQTYRATYLSDMGPKRPYRAALDVVREFRQDIMRLRTLGDVQRFVDAKVRERIGKEPRWGSYSMPD